METETAAVAEVGGQKKSGKRGSKQGEANGCGGDHGGGQSEHDMHIWTERERRKKMRNMFSTLHNLLPQLPAKADKSTILDEAVTYIKNLQQTLQTLEKRKVEKLRTWATVDYDQSSSIITSQVQASLADNQGPTNNYPLTIDMSPTFPSQMKPGTLATIMYILEKHRLEVVSAHVSSDEYHSISMYMIHVHAGGVSQQFPGALSMEETFKLAAGEMNLTLFSG